MTMITIIMIIMMNNINNIDNCHWVPNSDKFVGKWWDGECTGEQGAKYFVGSCTVREMKEIYTFCPKCGLKINFNQN